jgi:hypothetical protein
MTNQPTLFHQPIAISAITVIEQTQTPTETALGKLFATSLAKLTLAEWLPAAYESLLTLACEWPVHEGFDPLAAQRTLEPVDFLADEKAEERRSAKVKRDAATAREWIISSESQTLSESLLEAIKVELSILKVEEMKAHLAAQNNEPIGHLSLEQIETAKATRVLLPGLRDGASTRIFKNWCADCKEYRPINHESTLPEPTPRTLSTNLQNTWKTIEQQWVELWDININIKRPNSRPEKWPIGFVTSRWVRLNSWSEEEFPTEFRDLRPELPAGKETKVSGYALKSCVGFTKTVDGEWEFAPPSITVPKNRIASDTEYLKWTNKMYHTPSVQEMYFLDDEGNQRGLTVIPFELWWSEQCLSRLRHLRMPVVLNDGPISYVGTTGMIARKEADHNSRDSRANAVFNAQQDSEAQTGLSICKRPACSATFVSVRKGHDYCTENCRKRHWEELHKGDN